MSPALHSAYVRVAVLSVLYLQIDSGRAEANTENQTGSIWWIGIASATIGVAGALLTPFIKDLMIQRWNNKKDKLDKEHEIFRIYAAPLAASCEKLIWRFSEIFIERRHHFLKKATLPLIYNQYKRHSTLYRIACLLGWIRAIHLELSALPRVARGLTGPISTAIKKIQGSLADGPHVELHRLKRMCEIWNLSLIELDETRTKSLATAFEIELHRLAGAELRDDSIRLRDVKHERKTLICQELADYLCKQLRRTTIDPGVLAEKVNEAIEGLSYREALIYRDWQDAIGDAMLEHDPDSVRRFKLIGYADFEKAIEGTTPWMEVFRGCIEDIDFDFIDPSDFRAKQLRDLAAAVSSLVSALSQSEDRDLIDAETLKVAQDPLFRLS